jgi:hypothetical protein
MGRRLLVIPIGERAFPEPALQDLLNEYHAEKRYVDEEKPYWLVLDAEDELSWELFNYFPDAHYRQAIDDMRDAAHPKREEHTSDADESALRRDGGGIARTPREQYVLYVGELAETDDLDTMLSYEEWLEEELAEMWDAHGSPYL